MVRHTHADAQETRTAILDSALRLFSRRGYERTSLSDIAKYAGVTRGAIYWHFDDKRELLLELCSRLDKEILRERLVFASNLDESNPLGKLHEWMLAHGDEKSLQFFRSNFFSMIDNIFRGTSGDAELQARIAELATNRRSALIEVLKNCVRKGQMPSNLDATAAADYLMIFIGGFMAGLKLEYSDTYAKNYAVYVDLTLKALSNITVDLVHPQRPVGV